MIPELVFFAILFFLVASAVCWACENETLREHSERRAVNRLADNSKKHKPQGMRPRSRYIKAGLQK